MCVGGWFFVILQEYIFTLVNISRPRISRILYLLDIYFISVTSSIICELVKPRPRYPIPKSDFYSFSIN
jgi:hypothetical protein